MYAIYACKYTEQKNQQPGVRKSLQRRQRFSFPQLSAARANVYVYIAYQPIGIDGFSNSTAIYWPVKETDKTDAKWRTGYICGQTKALPRMRSDCRSSAKRL